MSTSDFLNFLKNEDPSVTSLDEALNNKVNVVKILIEFGKVDLQNLLTFNFSYDDLDNALLESGGVKMRKQAPLIEENLVNTINDIKLMKRRTSLRKEKEELMNKLTEISKSIVDDVKERKLRITPSPRRSFTE